MLGGFTTIQLWECFPGPIKIVTFRPRQGVEVYYRIIFRQLQVRGFFMCSVGIFSRGCYKQERHNTLLSSGSSWLIPSPLAAERKRYFWSKRHEVIKIVSLWRQEAPLFLSMRRFRFLSEASWETVTFAFFLFYFLCYCLLISF